MNIKNCPFCGCSASIRETPLFHGSRGYIGCYSYRVVCDNIECGALINRCVFDSIDRSKEEAAWLAVNKWNNREHKKTYKTKQDVLDEFSIRT